MLIDMIMKSFEGFDSDTMEQQSDVPLEKTLKRNITFCWLPVNCRVYNRYKHAQTYQLVAVDIITLHNRGIDTKVQYHFPYNLFTTIF